MTALLNKAHPVKIIGRKKHHSEWTFWKREREKLGEKGKIIDKTKGTRTLVRVKSDFSLSKLRLYCHLSPSYKPPFWGFSEGSEGLLRGSDFISIRLSTDC
jgi:hypothetical protein